MQAFACILCSFCLGNSVGFSARSRGEAGHVRAPKSLLEEGNKLTFLKDNHGGRCVSRDSSNPLGSSGDINPVGVGQVRPLLVRAEWSAAFYVPPGVLLAAALGA